MSPGGTNPALPGEVIGELLSADELSILLLSNAELAVKHLSNSELTVKQE